MRKIIGIDLGTTNSRFAVLEGSKPVVISNREGNRSTPSMVAFAGNGEWLVGQVAKRQAVTNSEGTVYAIKRLMGRKYGSKEVQYNRMISPFKITEAPNGDAQVSLLSRNYSCAKISSMILAKMKQIADDYLGEMITDAIIAVPANFNYAQRQATKEAGKIAGLNVIEIVNETTVAAMAYGMDKKTDEKIAVFDLGGGKFAISILELGDGVFEVKSTSGDASLGGEDFDQRIIEYLTNKLKNDQGIDIRKDKMALQCIKEAAEKAKMDLSSSMETDVNFPFITADISGPKHMSIKLTRAELEAIVEDLIEKIVPPCRMAMKDAVLTPDEIDKIILVGGMTRMPCVQQKVMEIFGKEPYKGINPDEAVAIGAAIRGGILTGDVKDVLPLDVTSYSLGIETLGGNMTRLIEKDTTIPCKKSQIFTTATDNQREMTIHILEGEGLIANDNLTIGRFDLDGITMAPLGVPQIEVTFDISPFSFHVSAKDLGTGKEQSIQGASVELTEKKDKPIDPMLLPMIGYHGQYT